MAIFRTQIRRMRTRIRRMRRIRRTQRLRWIQWIQQIRRIISSTFKMFSVSFTVLDFITSATLSYECYLADGSATNK